MRRFGFNISVLLWMSTMGAMSALGPIGRHAWVFALLYLLGFILLVAMFRLFPKGISVSKSLVMIFLVGVTARLLFLYFPENGDLNRYIWEGYIQTFGINPYLHAPIDPELSHLAGGALKPVWEGVNHKDFSSCYPPLTLLLFRLIAELNPDPAHAAFWVKSAVLAFDIGVMIVLTGIIRKRSISPDHFLLYAANPLIIVFIAGEGHLESIQVFFFVLSIYFFMVKRRGWGYFCLGLAGMAKYLALIAVPFFFKSRDKWRLFALFIPFLLYLPFIDAGRDLVTSVGAFAAELHYNDSVTVLLRAIFGDVSLVAAALAFGSGLFWIWLSTHDDTRSIYYATGLLILFLPTLHPWYLALITPFLVLYPSRAWIFLSAAMCLTFPVSGIEFNTGVFQEIHWIKPFIYLPFFSLLFYAGCRDGHLRRKDARERPPENISVIIPALNEASRIEGCIDALSGEAGVKEIIVVDGGSSDSTVDTASAKGARVLSSARGRGIQIRRGIRAAGGDIVLVLHADCRLHASAPTRIIHALTRRPHAVGGAFGMRFDRKTSQNRLIAFLNNLRACLTGISFGDQAQFFRRDDLRDAGGFPAMKLMEDVEICYRMKARGRLIYLKNGVTVSSRRWTRTGFSANAFVVLKLFFRYLVERRLGMRGGDKTNYYNAYYGQRKP